ncbi:MAG: O-antigen ligase family protein [Sphingopyxis sp.]|uniref:O-antigen ligase family protein n=1 Tax=Sphingopyxis sp. TaxID=1908224 RepID=UPI002ABCC212|nr:O-antigen ligase family protein [Sphingopyxis sp.]MDZ3831687.1 O-antigen ligase family protein [Sphingopyxis sp.]
MALQLVPLPPEIWQGLPTREPIVAIDRLLGQPDLWRPLSLTPSLTLNSLLAMTVPIAALLVAAQIGADDYPRILWALVVIACFSALLGLVQILSGSSSPVYLYRIVSTGSMVGLFANRNHHAIFMACMIPVVGMLLRDELTRRRSRAGAREALAVIGATFTLLTVLIGSRAGLVAGAVAFLIGYFCTVGSWTRSIDNGASSRVAHKASQRRRLLRFAPPAVVVLLVGVTFWMSGRPTGLSRLVEESAGEDLRVAAWPTTQSMIEAYWGVGSGFGSFPGAYKMFEPDHLLQPSYFNHAHNDWAEVIIVGGAPFVLIILVALIWFARQALKGGTRNLVKGYRGDLRLGVTAIIAILTVVSLVEYPLRVPSLQAFAIFLVIFLCRPNLRTSHGD